MNSSSEKGHPSIWVTGIRLPNGLIERSAEPAAISPNKPISSEDHKEVRGPDVRPRGVAIKELSKHKLLS